jgi:hypothetical protein
MAHGMEGRTPFLDPEVARLAFWLADRWKVRGRQGKWLLRRWLQRHCPAAEPFARKAGFTTPVKAWIAPRAAALGPRIAEVAGVRQLSDPETVRSRRWTGCCEGRGGVGPPPPSSRTERPQSAPIGDDGRKGRAVIEERSTTKHTKSGDSTDYPDLRIRTRAARSNQPLL